MSENMKVAIIGDAGLCLPFRAMGWKVFSPPDFEAARAAMDDIEKGGFGLCFVHEKYFEALLKERGAAEKKLYPVIVGFSDYRKVSDHLDVMLKEMAIRATGSDSLVKRKGNHESR